MKKKFIVALLMTLLAGVAAFAIETDGKYLVVDVDGQGENRLDAIESGLIEALRLASGSFIDSKTEMNNEELNERIISYSRGSISKYEVTMADDTKAAEGIYKVKLKVWVESELLRDGVKIATNKTAKVSFRKSDLQPEKESLKAAALENKDSMAATNKSNAASGVEALSAMLERYNPEDFINIKAVGKVTPVKGQDNPDLCQILVEISFNEQLYNEAFIPDLKQVLDAISAKKKDITLTKQRDVIRRINDKKGAPMADNSIFLSETGLGKEFQIAIYDKPDRFGCRLYGFKKEDADKILNNLSGPLAKFKGRIARLKGLELEILDDKDEIVSTEEKKITLPFLLTDSVLRNNLWAFHPTFMNYMGMYAGAVPLYIENKAVTLPVRFELPKEFQDITAAMNTKFVYEDDYAEAALKTRNALHEGALNTLSNKSFKSYFEPLAETGYSLAEVALDSIKANEIRRTNGLLVQEVFDRLAEFREKGNYAALKYTFYALEDSGNFENQKKAVQYLTQASMVEPQAMIRMGEVLEQGFYGVTPNPKKAAFYFDEGRRILSLLAAQGMPQAANALGHIYIEGLGTRQDIPKAERYFKFAEEKAQYNDREYWFWKHYGITLRQVTVPENTKKIFNEVYNIKKNLPANYQTCLCLVREGWYVPVLVSVNIGSYNTCDIKPEQFFGVFRIDENGTLLYKNIFFHQRELGFYIARNGKLDRIEFNFR